MTDSRNPVTRLTRSVDDNVFAGVCGGLGEQFGINAWWFRWAFIILTLFGFAGVFFYILAWILIPKETEDESVATSWMEGLDLTDLGTIFGVVLIGVAGVIVLSQFFHVSGGLVAAGVLAIVGVLLYRGDLRPPDKPDDGVKHYLDEDELSPETDSAADRADTAASTGTPPIEASAVPVVTVTPTKPAKPKKAPKPKPPKSMLGRLTMAVGLIVLSVMAMVELLDWYSFQPIDYAAASMIVVSLGLIVGAWIGRARWLIVIGLLLAPWLLFAAAIPWISDWSVGDPSYNPQTAADVGGSYELGIGQLTIDLTDLSADELAEIGVIDASVGIGELVVRVPDSVSINVDAEVGIGAVASRYTTNEGRFVFDDSFVSASGIGIDRSFSVGIAAPYLDLNLEAGIGEVEVQIVSQDGNYTGSEG
ncbi:MAG: PspC domain-containing protein [Actinomycetota bacterium]